MLSMVKTSDHCQFPDSVDTQLMGRQSVRLKVRDTKELISHWFYLLVFWMSARVNNTIHIQVQVIKLNSIRIWLC